MVRGVNSFVVDPLFKKIMRNHTQMMLAFQKMVRFCTIKKEVFHLLEPTFLYLSHYSIRKEGCHLLFKIIFYSNT